MFSCNKEKKKCKDFDATYNGDVKNIFERSCNNNSCHPGLKGGWGVLADFSSYKNVLLNLENGKIEERIFNSDSNLLMPPVRWAEERKLTVIDSEILRCWLDNGYPEN